MAIAETDLQPGTKALPMNLRDENPTPVAPAYELIIEPGRAEKNYWRELWRYFRCTERTFADVI